MDRATNFSALIPDCFQSLIKTKFILRGMGNTKGIFYILKMLLIYICKFQSLYLEPNKISGEVFNAGSNRGHKVKDIVKMILK